MEKRYANIVGTPVVAEDVGRPVAVVRDVIMDPESGKLIAFITNVAKNLVLVPMDVLDWTGVILVRGRRMIINADEVLRIASIQKLKTRFYRNKVFTKDDKFLGKVLDFTIDDKSYALKNLFVAKEVLGMLRYQQRIVPAKDIVEVLPDKIVIKEDKPKVKEKKLKTKHRMAAV